MGQVIDQWLRDNLLQEHDLQQGSPEWHAFRMAHDGSSEAAAMLGISSKVTRAELLTAKKTGIAREFGEWVQANVLDYGHEVEAMARPIIEKRLGFSLYASVLSRGRIAASCDGLNASGKIGWEHKQWNDALAADVACGYLPDEYMAQPQQQLLVTGAEKWIFTVSDGTGDKMVSIEIRPDPAWFERIIAGWRQFNEDLESHEVKEEVPKITGRAPDQLPALLIEVTGMVHASNLAEFKTHALSVFAGINTALATDEDFANAAKTVKWCGDVEERLEAAKQHALAQTASIDELFRAIDAIKDEAKRVRLDLFNKVESRKKAIRVEKVQAAAQEFAAHVADLQAELPGIRLSVSAPDFGAAIKGLKSIASIDNAIAAAMVSGKIAVDAMAKDVRDKLAWCKENAAGMSMLFPDLPQIITKPLDDFRLVITSRIDKHKADEAAKAEAATKRIDAEAKAKAEREAAEKMAADEARIRAEERAKAEAEAKVRAEANTKHSGVEIPLSETANQGGTKQTESTLADKANAISGAGTLHNPRPTRMAMIEVIAKHYFVSVLTADEWLRAEFSA